MPKISAATYQARRTHILNAARSGFARAGIGISIDEVCETARVSKGAFYGYFKSKDAMFEAMARHHGDMLRSLPPPADRGGLIAMLLERASVTEPAFARVELDTMAYAARHPVLNAIFVENAESLRRMIRASLSGFALAAGMDQARAAQMLESATLGAFLTIALCGAAVVPDARQRIVDSVDFVLATSGSPQAEDTDLQEGATTVSVESRS